MDHFLELYGTLPRAGPGDNALTRRAFGMVQHLPPHPRILDIGCGPGMQTVELLRLCEGTVVAIDLLPSMIARTRQAAERAGVSDRLEVVQIDTIERKLEVVSRKGYEDVGHFVLPPEAWTRHYYDHLAVRVAECESGWKGDSEAEAALREARTELAVFERCSEYYSYAFFVMRR